MPYISEISTKPLISGKNPTQDRVFALLDQLKIPYECVENDVVETMDECKALDEALGTEIRKSLLVRNQKKTKFFLVVVPADKRVDMKELAQKLGAGKLSFASADSMEEYLGCQPGSASVMGTVNDRNGMVQIVFDEVVAKAEWFGCNAGINTSHLKLRTEDVLHQFLPHIDHSATVMVI